MDGLPVEKGEKSRFAITEMAKVHTEVQDLLVEQLDVAKKRKAAAVIYAAERAESTNMGRRMETVVAEAQLEVMRRRRTGWAGNDDPSSEEDLEEMD